MQAKYIVQETLLVDIPLNAFEKLRQRYHTKLQQTIWHLTPPPENSKLKTPVPSNADHYSKPSVAIALGLLENTQAITKRADGQTSGKIFTDITLEFLSGTYKRRRQATNPPPSRL